MNGIISIGVSIHSITTMMMMDHAVIGMQTRRIIITSMIIVRMPIVVVVVVVDRERIIRILQRIVLTSTVITIRNSIIPTGSRITITIPVDDY